MKRRRVILLVALGMVATIGAVLLFAYVAMTGRFSGMIYRYTGSGKWLYSALYPVVWLISRLDKVLFFLKGYGLMIWAKRMNR